MRLEIVRLVFLKELRETLRDRRTLAILLGFPLLLYPLLTVGVAGLAAQTRSRMAGKQMRVAVVGGGAAPLLLEEMRQPEWKVRFVNLRRPETALAKGDVDVLVVVPAHYEKDALDSREKPLRVRLDYSRMDSAFAEARMTRLLDAYQRRLFAGRLQARGLPAGLAQPLRHEIEDTAAAGQRLGSILAMILPMLLLFSGMMGAYVPAVSATATERERGTLETLLASPARKMELLVAKGALVLLVALAAAGLNALSMAVALLRALSMATAGGLPLAISPGALALAYLAAVPSIILFAAMLVITGLMARNYSEASAYSSLVMFLPMAPLLVTIGQPKPTPGLLTTPVVSTAVIIREVLVGHATAGQFLLAFLSSGLYAALLLGLAARLFTTEHLVNPTWEPLSLKGLSRKGAKRRPRLPVPEEALGLFGISMWLNLLIAPAWLKWGLLPLTACTEILLIAGPALLLALAGRYRWAETFSWRRPSGRAMAGALLAALGMMVIGSALLLLQAHFWPPDPEMGRRAERLLLPALRRQPFLAPLLVGLFAGVCEELAYRGVIQAAFVRRLPGWFAVAAAALLFAAAHLRAYDAWLIFAIGLFLGWTVLQTGSIFPAMLAHMAFDTSKLGLSAWLLRVTPDPKAADARFDGLITSPWVIALALALLLAGWRLLRAGGAGRRAV